MIAVLYPPRALVTVSIFLSEATETERQVTITQPLKKMGCWCCGGEGALGRTEKAIRLQSASAC